MYHGNDRFQQLVAVNINPRHAHGSLIVRTARGEEIVHDFVGIRPGRRRNLERILNNDMLTTYQGIV